MSRRLDQLKTAERKRRASQAKASEVAEPAKSSPKLAEREHAAGGVDENVGAGTAPLERKALAEARQREETERSLREAAEDRAHKAAEALAMAQQRTLVDREATVQVESQIRAEQEAETLYADRRGITPRTGEHSARIFCGEAGCRAHTGVENRRGSRGICRARGFKGAPTPLTSLQLDAGRARWCPDALPRKTQT